MRLGIRLLDDMLSVNSFRVAEEFYHINGNSQTMYFQLVSITDACAEPVYNRYIPDDLAELSIKFLHIDSNKEIIRVATMAFPLDDRSIWKVDIAAGDSLAPDSVVATLTEGGVAQKLIFVGTFRTVATDVDRFFC